MCKELLCGSFDLSPGSFKNLLKFTFLQRKKNENKVTDLTMYLNNTVYSYFTGPGGCIQVELCLKLNANISI